MVSHMMVQEWNLLTQFAEMSLTVKPINEGCLMATMSIEPDLIESIRVAQRGSPRCKEIIEEK